MKNNFLSGLVFAFAVVAGMGIQQPFNNGVTSGQIILIDSGTCATGYTEVSNLQGRIPVGTPSGGTIGSNNGVSTYTDLENRSHTHTVPGLSVPTTSFSTGTSADDTHNHGGLDGTGAVCCTGGPSANHTHSITATNGGTTGTGTSGGTTGIIATYQVRYCKKN